MSCRFKNCMNYCKMAVFLMFFRVCEINYSWIINIFNSIYFCFISICNRCSSEVKLVDCFMELIIVFFIS